MRNLKLNQKGFSYTIVLALVLVAVVGFAGYRVYSVNKGTNSAKPATTVSSGSNTVPSKIKNAADVKSAASALDKDQTDKQLDPAQLNADLNSLL
jgi:hypothetical protein